MNAVQLACDQAIFTSIRTPTGEGYRIVAASPGLKPEEKQVITRNSPSHESICPPPPEAGEQTMAAAFYPLPTGRLCVAYSCLAGAEHTGRGGFRVYTVNVIFDREEFPCCGYNPFNVVRAMASAGLTQPLLKPAQALPKVDLVVALNPLPGAEPSLPAEFKTPYRCRVLELALSEEEVLVDIPHTWISAAEAVLLAIPGERRAELSMSAGLRFTTGRKHRLQLLHDDKHVLRNRVAGQDVTYIDVCGQPPAAGRDSAWTQFVERHWQAGDFATLSKRTSRTFVDTDESGLEQIGAMYNLIDSLDKLPTMQTLERVSTQLRGKQSSRQPELIDEFLDRAQSVLRERLEKGIPEEYAQVWKPLLVAWRHAPDGTEFAQPVVRGMMDKWARLDALSAAEAALDLTRDVPPGLNAAETDSLIESILARFAATVARAAPSQTDRVDPLVTRWQRVRPNSPSLARLSSRETASSPG